MIMMDGWDEANKDRRERINKTAIDTADKINRRMKMFMRDINKNHSLTKVQKSNIKDMMLKDFI